MRFQEPCRRGLAGAIACISLLGAASAQAATVTLGSALTDPTFHSVTFGSVSTFAQTSLPGQTTISPITGTIINWKVVGAVGGPFRLQVVHPLGGGFFNGAGTTAPGVITGTGILTFTSDLRIEAGDLVGVRPTADTDKIALSPTGEVGTNFDFWNPPLTDGGSGQVATGALDRELGLQATVVTDCVVPGLKGRKLRQAQSAVTAAGCTNGTVTKPKKKSARRKAKFVVGQNPSAGQTVEGLSPVNVTLGKKPKKK